MVLPLYIIYLITFPVSNASCLFEAFLRLFREENKNINYTNYAITSPKPVISHPFEHQISSFFRFKGVNGCEAVKPISNGAFGHVWLVRMPDFIHNKEAALKVFYGGDFMFECKREKSVLQHIAAYEHESGKQLQIAHIREDIQGVKCPNLMLEYIRGVDLQHQGLKIMKKWAFSFLSGFVKRMLEQISDGVLNDLHSMNIYHNDLKPQNIMFVPNTQKFYLVDFGLAVPLSLLNHSEFRRTDFFTTLQFMSPWHLKLLYTDDGYKNNITNDDETKSYAKKADFYSLALTAIRILGKNCHGIDTLCFMSKRIVSLQDNYFSMDEQQSFVNWDYVKIERVLSSYWGRIQGILMHYNIYVQQSNLDSKSDALMSKLKEWLTPYLK